MTQKVTVYGNQEVPMYRVVQAELVMTCLSKAERKQNGAALILLVFILAIAMTTYLVKTLNSDTLKVEREHRVMQNLGAAKESLISWAVSNSVHPGQMPYPDRGNDGNYDGSSDCNSTITTNLNLLIGKLPVYGHPIPNCAAPNVGLGLDNSDDIENRFWYAVSPHLIHNFNVPDPIINSSIVNDPTKQWLRVLDKNGVTISDRVAAVIIAPGNAIGNQNRTNIATAGNFLDTFIGGSNSDYNNLDEDFFIVDGLPEFNDKLVYITIDELMVTLEKRVVSEVAMSLRVYFNNNGYFPYASLDFSNNACGDGERYGLLPLNACSTNALTTLPNWFVDNGWDDLLFYAVSSDCTENAPLPRCASGTLTVGSQSNVNALVITTGPILPGQTRPNLTLSNYLDSPENTDGDDEFDAVGTPLTNTYNDQMFIVSP